MQSPTGSRGTHVVGGVLSEPGRPGTFTGLRGGGTEPGASRAGGCGASERCTLELVRRPTLSDWRAGATFHRSRWEVSEGKVL